ncbi:hypothetical protein MPL1_02006 [Methylophaga lonarensis MPL]|uniref:Uncharacterized protein n=1 Tax=Methylophaga lonarensis MPL TaxID=1286106 RepID=M7NYW8_9GAMM|nr:hypothetical protein [Methylophaga lonarensis]EMR14033.1 hypothetical protein MPL1_02006 [Methylophaga lonarensis MPL]
MGKKLARTALKHRTETLQAERRERNSKATLLLERWGQSLREQASGVWVEGSEPENIEDQMTSEVMSSLTPEILEIARLHWSMGNAPAEIASKTTRSRTDIREHLAAVRELVADKVLM